VVRRGSGFSEVPEQRAIRCAIEEGAAHIGTHLLQARRRLAGV
jgi:hypothetical protein